jgi:hypothetical protein
MPEFRTIPSYSNLAVTADDAVSVPTRVPDTPSRTVTACADMTTLGRMLISSLGTVVTLTGVAVAKFTALYWTGLLMLFL